MDANEKFTEMMLADSEICSLINGLSIQRPKVKIILEIPQREWTFWSQAGALRRIVMNLFGNS